MQPQTLVIPGKLPNLNEILEATGYFHGRGKKRSTGFSRMKKTVDAAIAAEARIQKIWGRTDLPIDIDYYWICANRMADKSNIAAGGRKFIEDALQLAGVIPNDGWKQIGDWTDRWLVDKGDPRIEITLGANLLEIALRVANTDPSAYVPGIPPRR